MRSSVIETCRLIPILADNHLNVAVYTSTLCQSRISHTPLNYEFKIRTICSSHRKDNFYKFYSEETTVSEDEGSSKHTQRQEKHVVSESFNASKKLGVTKQQDANVLNLTHTAGNRWSTFQNQQDSNVLNLTRKARQRWPTFQKQTNPATTEATKYEKVKAIKYKKDEDTNYENIDESSIFAHDPKGVKRIKESWLKPVPTQDILQDVTSTWVKGNRICLTGLPFSMTAEDIVSFLGAKVVGGEEGVNFTYSLAGSFNGKAYMDLESKDDLELALQKHGQTIKQKRITVEKTTRRKMEDVLKKHGKWGTTQSKTGYYIYMNKLPPNTTEGDILQFLRPCSPVYVFKAVLNMGRARVDFASHQEAEQAMCKKDELFSGHSINIFLHSLDLDGSNDYVLNKRERKRTGVTEKRTPHRQKLGETSET